MPWDIAKHGNQYCVTKKGESSPIPGGCHPSAKEAERHRRALYANVSDSQKELWLTREQVKQICPSCAQKMAVRNIKRINLLELPPSIKAGFSQGLCDKVGGDPGFFTRCTQMNISGVDDMNAFCASLHKFCLGTYPAEKTSLYHFDQTLNNVKQGLDDFPITDQINRVFTAWMDNYPEPESAPRLVEIYDGYCVVDLCGDMYRVDFTVDDNGEITFDDLDAWTPVQPITTWEELKSLENELLAVKFVNEDQAIIHGYQVLFGDEKHHDLSQWKDYFTKSTDYWLQHFPTPKPLAYHHGLDEATKDVPVIGTVLEQGIDDLGVWYKAQLDKAHRYFEYIKRLIEKKALGTSSDSLHQYVIRESKADGVHEVQRWPLPMISLTPTPAEHRMFEKEQLGFIQNSYKSLGLAFQLPQDAAEGAQARAASANEQTGQREISDEGAMTMPGESELTVQKVAEIASQKAADVWEKERARAEKESAAAKELEAMINTGIENGVKAQLAKIAKERGNPNLFADATKVEVKSQYDFMPVEDLAFLTLLRTEAKKIGKSHGADNILLRTLAAKSFKLIEQERLDVKAMLGLDIKANEIMQSNLAGSGDEWVFSNVSTQLWQKVRAAARVLPFLPQGEIPQGYESETIPLEDTDFTFYNVAQAANEDATMKTPAATITSSKMGTAQRIITVGKLGARGTVTGELDEDSIIPSIAEVRGKLERQAAEEIDFVLMNMDNTAATDNINDAGTPVTGSDYTIGLGIIRNALKNASAANAVNMGGVAITTAKIRSLYITMGTDGYLVAEAPNRCHVFSDYGTWWSMEGMSDILTAANAGESRATVVRGLDAENGMPIHGVLWFPSGGVRKAQATGIRHGTETNNTFGRAVLVRDDMWRLRWKRRITFETTRIPRADVTEIVAMFRFGLGYFSTEASSILYNILIPS